MNSTVTGIGTDEAKKNKKENETWISIDEARKAIEQGTGRGVKIAVIDSGIELSHPRLRHVRLIDDVAYEWNKYGVLRRVLGNGKDVHGHGTAVTSIILRKEAAPEAQIGSFRVMDQYNQTRYSILEEAAKFAIDQGYNIINFSLGTTADLKTIGYFKPWIDYAYTQGVHIVAACNNINFREGEWPGFFPSVITVDKEDTQSEEVFFRWDPPRDGVVTHLVEFAARGVNLTVPWKDGDEYTGAYGTGSSYAAPHVAGRLARLLSVYPRLKPLVAKSLLQEIAKKWTANL